MLYAPVVRFSGGLGSIDGRLGLQMTSTTVTVDGFFKRELTPSPVSPWMGVWIDRGMKP